MKKRYWALCILGIFGAGIGAAAYVATPTIHAGMPGDAPELGRPGPQAIGTTLTNLTIPDSSRIGTMSLVTGGISEEDRTLSVRLWYPADQAAGEGSPGTTYSHEMTFAGLDPFEIASDGIATTDAAPSAGEKLPLVVMSHGYGGWSTQFSNLAEHIASRGYIVASIEHADMQADDLPSFMVSFGNVLQDRTQDQRAVIAHLRAEASQGTDPILSRVDTENVGLIGYSMGGYGALATAGAAYDFDAGPVADLPDDSKAALSTAQSEGTPIKSVVTFAPWGSQPDSRAWTAESLAKIDIPVLIAVGNQDDVVNYDEGVRWLFESLSGTSRHMLVYREARHNIVGNDFTIDQDTPFQAIEFMSEPVWRTDRMNAINQHFVAAFLDMTLKGDAEKSAYLDVPTVDANAGEWPSSLGEQWNGALAGAEQDQYWRGFQRRWAAGLEMHRLEAGGAP